MRKRQIVLLAGLMVLGVTSFAMESSNSETLKSESARKLSIFNINDRVRYDENRLEVNGNLHLNENNRLEIRVRSYDDVGYGLGDERISGNSAEDRTEIRMRLHTQTSIDNLEVRTEVKTNTYGDSGNKQYFRVQPTYYFVNEGSSFSLVRAGLGYTHDSRYSDSSDSYQFTSSFENHFVINDYLDLEGNLYYDYDYAETGSKATKNNVDIEAYFYTNYPLYENEQGYKIVALFEGGFDPYSFGARHFGDLTDASSEDTDNGHETYVLYFEPSIKISKTINSNNSAYLQGGYYTENNEGTSSNQYEDTAFVRVGFTSKF